MAPGSDPALASHHDPFPAVPAGRILLVFVGAVPSPGSLLGRYQPGKRGGVFISRFGGTYVCHDVVVSDYVKCYSFTSDEV